jgi:hypothetical protein
MPFHSLGEYTPRRRAASASTTSILLSTTEKEAIQAEQRFVGLGTLLRRKSPLAFRSTTVRISASAMPVDGRVRDMSAAASFGWMMRPFSH